MQRKFGRSLDEIQNIVDFTGEFFDTHAIDSSVRYIVDLCVEELFVNMVTYDTETDAPLEQRTPGGLGLYLVLKMVNSIHYEYRNRNSKITFIADRK